MMKYNEFKISLGYNSPIYLLQDTGKYVCTLNLKTIKKTIKMYFYHVKYG